MLDEDSEYSTRMNHTIGPHQWAALATGESLVKFICTLGDGKASYGKIVDCAETIKVCEYVHVKFGLNNKGNFWIADGNTRNGAVNEVVHPMLVEACVDFSARVMKEIFPSNGPVKTVARTNPKRPTGFCNLR